MKLPDFSRPCLASGPLDGIGIKTDAVEESSIVNGLIQLLAHSRKILSADDYRVTSYRVTHIYVIGSVNFVENVDRNIVCIQQRLLSGVRMILPGKRRCSRYRG